MKLTSIILHNAIINSIEFKSIYESVAVMYSIKPSDLFIRTRKRNISEARHVCMYILRKHFNFSTIIIGKIFGKNGKIFDHSTVSCAIKKIENLYNVDKNFKRFLDNIDKTINQELHND